VILEHNSVGPFKGFAEAKSNPDNEEHKKWPNNLMLGKSSYWAYFIIT